MGWVAGYAGRMGRVAGYAGRMGRRVGWDVGSDGSGLRTGRMGRFLRIARRGRSEANPRGDAGRTGVRSAYFGEGR